ncbi:MAG: hypothetical protein NTY48_05485 [Candidatus Diapherotrites archaeon]|nr:hypothetical protein [Candidatus Diapherotrites archaeon]
MPTRESVELKLARFLALHKYKSFIAEHKHEQKWINYCTNMVLADFEKTASGENWDDFQTDLGRHKDSPKSIEKRSLKTVSKRELMLAEIKRLGLVQPRGTGVGSSKKS